MQAVAAEMNLSETAFVRAARRRRPRPALVHADHRGRPVRPRHPGVGPRARRCVPVPHPERSAHAAGPAADGTDRDGLPGHPRAAGRRSAGLVRGRSALAADRDRRRVRGARLGAGRAGDRPTTSGRPCPTATRSSSSAGYALVTAAGDQPGVDSVCRYLRPRPPASTRTRSPARPTASSAPFWAGRLGRTELVGEQASARGGTVGMRLDGDQVVLIGPRGHRARRRAAGYDPAGGRLSRRVRPAQMRSGSTSMRSRPGGRGTAARASQSTV